ncbi:MAG: hypothetical protein IJ189_00455 [Clostridia bacterium]|nr:hypothetical protein [Clostridia bacterium]
MKNTLLIVCAILVLIIIRLLFNDSPIKWYLRQDCLCGRAYFHAGEKFAPDEMLFNEIEARELSDEQMQVYDVACKKHHVVLWIKVMGSNAYYVQMP